MRILILYKFALMNHFDCGSILIYLFEFTGLRCITANPLYQNICLSYKHIILPYKFLTYVCRKIEVVSKNDNCIHTAIKNQKVMSEKCIYYTGIPTVFLFF